MKQRLRPFVVINLFLLLLSLSACKTVPGVPEKLAPAATELTFDVMRNGPSYDAVPRTTDTSYTGTLKVVVESAVADLVASGGGSIIFAAGDFDLGPDWLELDDVTDVVFEGQGINVTTLHNSSDAPTDTEPFDCTRCDRITVRDMTVSASGTPRETSDALDFDGGDDNLIERVKVTGSRGRGIIFDGKDDPAITGGTADRNVVRDCVITGVPRDGIQLLASNNNRIENCTITDVGGDGIRVHKASASAGQPHKKSNDNLISGNTIDNAGTVGIRVNSGDRNHITGNTVLNSSDDVAGQDGIRIQSDSSVACDDNTVDYNTASDNQPVKTQRYGLTISSPACNRTVVRGNTLLGNLVGEVNDNGTGTLFTSSVLTFTPTDDATLRENRPTRNIGAEPVIEADASFRKDALLRFEVSGIGTSNIASATLRLYAVDGSPVGGDFFKVTDSAWSETTVTWATAPPGDGGSLGSLGAVGAGQWYELDVTSLVTGDSSVSVRISSRSADGADYSSKDNPSGNAPELVVTLAAPSGADVSPPSAPGSLMASDVQAKQVSLSWNASSDDVGVATYTVYRDGGQIGSVSGSATSFQDSAAAPETTYHYFVRAHDAAGNLSAPSNTLTLTTPAALPLVFDVTTNGTTYEATSQTTSSSYAGTLKFVVESAVDELMSLAGGSIIFAAGTFDLGPDWLELDDVTDVVFEGQGIDVTVIRNNSSAATDTEPFDCTRCDRLTIRDMTVHADGPFRNTSDALDFDGGDDNLIERVKVTGARGRGIIFDGKDAPAFTGGTADRNVVRDCIITGVPRDGIQLLASSHNVIENCTITNVGGDGIRVHKAGASADQPDKPSNDNLISGNHIDNAGESGIRVNSGSRNIITGNTVLNSSDDVSGQDGIRIQSGNSVPCDDNLVEFNSASDNQSVKTQRFGLNITSAACNRTVVRSNDFSGNLVADSNDDGTATSFGPSELTFTPTDDVYIKESSAASNYGSDIAVKADSSSLKDALLRFDISGVGTAPVSKATLRLFAIDGSPVGGDFFWVTDNTWNEATVTWNTAPPGDGGSLGSLGRVKAGSWYELDVTPLVTEDGPVSLRISSTSANGADYSSKEHSNGHAPELIVERR